MKKGFVLYFDAYPQLTALSMEQRGELMTAVFEYAFRAAGGELDPQRPPGAACPAVRVRWGTAGAAQVPAARATRTAQGSPGL